jgi:DNA-binding NtrC family response regulator
LSSGYNEQEVLSRFAGRGYAGFIQKPYQLDELEQKLRDVFEKPGSQQE